MDEMRRKSFIAGLTVVVVAFLLALGATALLRPRRTTPAAPVPNPNGYDDLARAGRMLTEDVLGFSKMSREELRAFVEKNDDALKLARLGLSRECGVPTNVSPTWLNPHAGDLSAIKYLAYTFVAEGRLAELEGRSGDAVRSYLDAVHLGHTAFRGGPMMWSLVAWACETIGLDPLQRVITRLDANGCRQTIGALETLEANRGTYAQVIRQEKAWARKALGWRGRIEMLVEVKELTKTRLDLKKKMDDSATRSRVLIIDLAVRAYELEKGERPKNWSLLVPDYLRSIPHDPVTGTDLAYSF
ncbi:MAG: hypothetical protein HYY24_16245 [Verrucomicrobia bacterium]|nr:hypothetical protein [Verrucomicrobiota bacterium]